ncbi:MAG: LysR family transcriptional regulator [Clostridiales bacterium]|nr:LysR family transcriptional regulator [Clostridiales bacterium]
MKLKQMEYFVAVAENLSFTRAARQCFISQTAMTLQIKSLEERLGVSLFIRDKHHVELTRAGKVDLNEGRAIRARREAAGKLGRTAAEGFSGVLNIGFIRGYEQSRFSETLRGFHESYPNISLHLIRDNMSALYRLLEDGHCDVVFNLSSRFQSYPGHFHRILKQVPMMAVLYPRHPLAEKKRLSYRELSGEDFIIMQPRERPVDETEEAILCYERGGFVPNIVEKEPEVQTLLLMVSAGLGIAVLPEYSVRYFQNTRNLVVIPLFREDRTEERMDFEISWKSENENPSIAKLLQWMEDRQVTE